MLCKYKIYLLNPFKDFIKILTMSELATKTHKIDKKLKDTQINRCNHTGHQIKSALSQNLPAFPMNPLTRKTNTKRGRETCKFDTKNCLSFCQHPVLP